MLSAVAAALQVNAHGHGPLVPPRFVSRGSLRGPHLTNVDTSLFKKIPINERFNMQFRAEIFNLFNHANFQEPNAIVFQGTGPSSSAGQILNTATFSRQIQLALKFIF